MATGWKKGSIDLDDIFEMGANSLSIKQRLLDNGATYVAPIGSLSGDLTTKIMDVAHGGSAYGAIGLTFRYNSNSYTDVGTRGVKKGSILYNPTIIGAQTVTTSATQSGALHVVYPSNGVDNGTTSVLTHDFASRIEDYDQPITYNIFTSWEVPATDNKILLSSYSYNNTTGQLTSLAFGLNSSTSVKKTYTGKLRVTCQGTVTGAGMVQVFYDINVSITLGQGPVPTIAPAGTNKYTNFTDTNNIGSSKTATRSRYVTGQFVHVGSAPTLYYESDPPYILGGDNAYIQSNSLTFNTSSGQMVWDYTISCITTSNQYESVRRNVRAVNKYGISATVDSGFGITAQGVAVAPTAKYSSTGATAPDISEFDDTQGTKYYYFTYTIPDHFNLNGGTITSINFQGSDYNTYNSDKITTSYNLSGNTLTITMSINPLACPTGTYVERFYVRYTITTGAGTSGSCSFYGYWSVRIIHGNPV